MHKKSRLLVKKSDPPNPKLLKVVIRNSQVPYNYPHWLRRLDLNQRPSGYELRISNKIQYN